ncbi:G1/S-specific cyclin Pcl5 [Rhodotorula toruloides]|uniref:BY PROTMAP: gi/472586198/gb/EMS23726.1/ G1/S-specific cyclin Pcl5 [Rhodosporidium toruloides NP11] gi/647397716/emb/CDR40952.1/ RHTO0S05e09582g1_1 [Rhodosporidium toruloides] n=1 Tax=Rhodotorula toruloides TaxID=5286 RepID=A0A0K3CSR5_RHOTO|nr:G1/S-specific cyclin Pcl5 [Rhodotorula toruloides]
MSSLLPTPPYAYPSAADEAAAYVAHASSLSALSHPQRSRSHSSVPLPDAKRPRSSTTSSFAAQDWTSSHPPSPALKPCTGAWTSSAVAHPPASASSEQPPPPLLHAQAHCPTPALTPDDEDDESHLEGRSGFVKRDDLTAKAVKRAQSLSTGGSAAGEGGKDRFVNGLVGASVLAIESIWGPSPSSTCTLPSPSSSSSSIIPLSYFVKEVLRRSRTSCSTLQLALYYLHKSRREIRAAVKRAGESEGEIKRLERELKRGKEEVRAGSRGQEGAYPSPPRSPGHELDAAAGGKEASQPQSLGDRFSALVAAQNSPVLCGRRMFLASLICASKYLQDRNYSNRAWAKISGLDVREINANERAFLKVTGFGLHLPAEEFQRWTERLAALNNSSTSSPLTSPATTTTIPSPLARSASEYHLLASIQPPMLAAGSRPSLPSSRKALARGSSAAVVYPTTTSTSATTTREKGFPIAAPRMAYRQPTPSSSSSEGETEAEESSSAYSFASASASDGRKLRALPTRRLRTTAGGMVTASPASFVPQAWAAGVVPMEGVVVSQMEGVRAH